MSERIIAFLVQFITHVIDMGGYAGIAAADGHRVGLHPAAV